ncbi:MAG: hypothetical protein K8S18_11850 [Desulfobacula sp.]|nr:hypothetical protein [Desulfobacula sp.]
MKIFTITKRITYRFVSIIDDLILCIIKNIEGRLGYKLRYLYYKRKLKYLGRDVSFGMGVRIINPSCVSIGNNCCIDDYVILIAGIHEEKRRIRYRRNKNFSFEKGEIVIGNRCHIAQYAYILGLGGVHIRDTSGLGTRASIFSFTNLYINPKDRSDIVNMGNQAIQETQYMMSGPVVLEENCHLLYDSFIAPGVTMKKNSIALPYSKVMCDLKENTIYEGNPAMPREKRFEIQGCQTII